jgi:hypothetical protein
MAGFNINTDVHFPKFLSRIYGMKITTIPQLSKIKNLITECVASAAVTGAVWHRRLNQLATAQKLLVLSPPRRLNTTLYTRESNNPAIFSAPMVAFIHEHNRSLYYIEERSGHETRITQEMIISFQNALQSQTETILDEIGVARLSPAQIARVQDGDGKGTGLNLYSFNSSLVDELHVDGPALMSAKRTMLNKISKLTLASMHLASIEGDGHIRYTETVSSLFTNPDNFSERSLRWVDGLLETCCAWWKCKTVAGEAALAAKRATMRTSTERSSEIVLIIALAVKPLEIRLVSEVFGATAASVHWHAFFARDGQNMCLDANLL